MPELAYVSYVGTVSNVNKNFPGEILGEASWKDGFYPSRSTGDTNDDTLTIVIRVYTSADKSSYVERRYELNIVVTDSDYYVYLDNDFANPLPLRRVEDTSDGQPQQRYVGTLSS